ncbi:DUF6288 domain-containing protein [Rubritalea tangerina]|uniref:DUF6288 domain-containing protein n=2 Tax=Rubritalea tangerina TaxID=430798 RepID=A0ABW4Z9P5_9BACT
MMILPTLRKLSPILLLAPQLTVAAESDDFQIDSWIEQQGTRIDLKSWKEYNPSPHRSYFSPTSTDCTKRWFINLGPLGINTLMHDRSWGIFPAQKEIFPTALTDKHGLAFNAFEVNIAKPNSPAEGKLQPGDLILGLNNHPFLAAQHFDLGKPVDNKTKRGLELHAGALIDAAESQGKILVNVLRLPEALKKKPLPSNRTVKQVARHEINGSTSIAIPLPKNADLCFLSTEGKRKGLKCEDLTLVNNDGLEVPVDLGGKRGAGNLIGSQIEIPAGEWTLKGTIESNAPLTLVTNILPKPTLPESYTPYLKRIELTLPKVGSFGSYFDPLSAKAKNYAAITAHRIAIQQEDNGSWKASSYASPSFYTSICGIALLSTDDPQYDSHIKKAAHYVALAGERDKWTYSNGMWLIFLAEYYLKTGDAEILPALKMHVANCRRFIMSDYTSGHSFAQPGYGGSGYIGGGGVIACALAVASHTPAMNDEDKAVLDKMLVRVQEIAAGGVVPYGRSGKSKHATAKTGQGGSCGSGPYFIASLIRGGAETFTQNAKSRYSSAPYGSAENGHATQTLHFFWSLMSSANCGEKAHTDSMSAFLWRFTNMREADGFMNKNNYRTEYHNGDGVIGEPYWRTAAYLTLMNAHKRNLAITGKPKYQHAPRTKELVFHVDKALLNDALRSWALVESYLGDSATPAFQNTLKKLRALESNEQLGTTLRDLLKAEAPIAAKSLLTVENLHGPISAGQLAETLLGISLEASCTPVAATAPSSKDKKADKKAQKLAEKKQKKLLSSGKLKEINHALRLQPFTRLQADRDSSSNALSSSLFKVGNMQIELADPSKKYFSSIIRHTPDLNAGSMTSKDNAIPALATFPFHVDQKATLKVKVSYQVEGIPISYVTDMPIPALEARSYVPELTQIPVVGTVIDDYSGSYSPNILLETGQVVGCEQRVAPAPYLLKGDTYRFMVSHGSVWGHDLRSATPLNSSKRVIKVASIQGAKDTNTLTDNNFEKGIKLTKGSHTLTFKFDSPQTIERSYLKLDLVSSPARAEANFILEAKVGDTWTLLRKGKNTGLMPNIVHTSDTVRLTIDVHKDIELKEVHFIKPPNQSPQQFFSW